MLRNLYLLLYAKYVSQVDCFQQGVPHGKIEVDLHKSVGRIILVTDWAAYICWDGSQNGPTQFLSQFSMGTYSMVLPIWRSLLAYSCLKRGTFVLSTLPKGAIPHSLIGPAMIQTHEPNTLTNAPQTKMSNFCLWVHFNYMEGFQIIED